MLANELVVPVAPRSVNDQQIALANRARADQAAPQQVLKGFELALHGID
jgi:hypothetical protein